LKSEELFVNDVDHACLDYDIAVELQRMRDGVLALLRIELRDRVLTEDLCNETFRIVLERVQRQPLEHPEKLASYVAQTARFVARTHLRNIRRRKTFTGQQDAIDEFGDEDLDPAAVTEAEARAKAVRQVLSEIPNVRDREVLVRVYLKDHDKEQVCLELGIDEAHFRRVIFRARERFRALLEKKYRISDLYCLALA
jgi:RNA polymerase sigma-70 factor (ECF subfamily)